jgi:uncharacterized RDD family membrane protein YckC
MFASADATGEGSHEEGGLVFHQAEPRVSMSPEKISYSAQSAEEQDSADLWRDAVASRLNSYRARKRRRVDGSMHLNFDGAAAPEMPAPQPAPARQPRASQICNTDFYRRANQEIFSQPEPEPEQAPEQLLAPSPEMVAELSDEVLEAAQYSPATADAAELDPFAFEQPAVFEAEPGRDNEHATATQVEELSAPEPPQEKRKVIVFPRPAYQPPILEPPRRDELAESIMHSPRILDVPEDVVPTIEGPLFAEVQIESEEEPLPRGPQIEVPLPVAFIGPRFVASIVDVAFVMIASSVFLGMNWSTLWSLPHGKSLFAGLAAIPVALWLLYEYVFMVYCGQTPGMRLLHLRLSRFDGRWPYSSNRRRRALFTMLSAASLGLGFLWAVVDEDMLCWHDRITQTFVTPEQ